MRVRETEGESKREQVTRSVLHPLNLHVYMRPACTAAAAAAASLLCACALTQAGTHSKGEGSKASKGKEREANTQSSSTRVPRVDADCFVV